MADGPVSDPIRSAFADDPDMLELVELYVAEMPERLRILEALWHSGDGEGLQRIAHQLKGASAGYGYGEVTDAARDLEMALVGSDVCEELEAVQREFEALVDVCSRVSM